MDWICINGKLTKKRRLRKVVMLCKYMEYCLANVSEMLIPVSIFYYLFLMTISLSVPSMAEIRLQLASKEEEVNDDSGTSGWLANGLSIQETQFVIYYISFARVTDFMLD